jgi:hypothetical protein
MKEKKKTHQKKMKGKRNESECEERRKTAK